MTHKKLALFLLLSCIACNNNLQANDFTSFVKKVTTTVTVVTSIATATIIGKTAYDNYQKHVEENCIPKELENAALYRYIKHYVHEAAAQTWQATKSKASELKIFAEHE